MPKIYFAAPLFNAPDCYFNSALTKKLKQKGHEVFLPQNDGFEFGRLSQALEGRIPEQEIPKAVQTIIGLLDIGFKLPDSDVFLARFDEPLDPGVIVEVYFAKNTFKIPVIGYRTDSRTPYGSSDEYFRGMHFFPGFQCDKLILCKFACRTPKQTETELEELADSINLCVKDLCNRKKIERPHYLKDPNITKLTKPAESLFGGIRDLSLDESLTEIVERYVLIRGDIHIFPEQVTINL